MSVRLWGDVTTCSLEKVMTLNSDPQFLLCLMSGAYGGTLRAPFKSAEKERKKAFVVFFPLSPSIAKGFFSGFQFLSGEV